MSETTRWIIMLAVAYFAGAVPFAYLIGKSKGIDIREHGSGNVGASNVGRVLGRKYGFSCFALDVLKGFVPTLVAAQWCGTWAVDLTNLEPVQILLWMGVGVVAILGHMFPVYLKFVGGKGVATGFGAMLGVFPHLTWPVLVAIGAWVLTLKITGWIGLASMVAASSVPVFWFAFAVWNPGHGSRTVADVIGDGWPFAATTAALAALVIWKHRTNIVRMLNGTEPRVGDAPHEHEVASQPAE